MSPRALQRGAISALAALGAAGALAGPAAAAVLSDSLPSPQARLANAEFLSQVPAPPTGAGTVCVIDTGVTPLPDLDTQLVERISVVGGNGDDVFHRPEDPFSGHGTFVAATIASRVDGVGSAGIWPAAKIVSVRVVGASARKAAPANYRVAIHECVRRPEVSVITLSLGASQASVEDLARLEDSVIAAREDFGVNVVASAGNEGIDTEVNYPARYDRALAVGASDNAGAFCRFSNRGYGLDLIAMGCDAYATGFDGRVGAFRGTSLAVPTVAAVLVALRSMRPTLTVHEAEHALLSTSTNSVVDAEAAFRALGLGAVVEAYRAPEAEAQRVVTTQPDGVGVIDARPARPKLRASSLKRGRLLVQVVRPPRRSAAIFQVGQRSYERKRGTLRLRLRSWRPVTVYIEDEWGIRSDGLKVRRPRR